MINEALGKEPVSAIKTAGSCHQTQVVIREVYEQLFSVRVPIEQAVFLGFAQGSGVPRAFPTVLGIPTVWGLSTKITR